MEGQINTGKETLEKIYNPLTKRYIQQTAISKGRKNKWNELMHSSGGFIAYCGELFPIDVEALSQWNDAELSCGDDVSDGCLSGTSLYRNYQQNVNGNESWNVIKADSMEHLDDLEVNSDDNDDDDIEYPILEQLLFVSKPSQLLTLPGIDRAQPALSAMVNEFLETTVEGIELMTQCRDQTSLSTQNKKKKKNKKQRNSFCPRPCHRLDYDTSGVIVIGLSPVSLRAVSNLFETRIVKKTYVALVAGHVQNDEGIIEYPIGKRPSGEGYNEFACYFDDRDDQRIFVPKSIRPAKTNYKVTNRFSIPVVAPSGGSCTNGRKYAKYSRVELEPHTGRGHQLRLHLEAIGHPILGDKLHGNVIVTPRLCLHSAQLEIIVRRGEDSSLLQRMRIISIPPF